MTRNALYLRRRQKLLLPEPAGRGELLPENYVVSVATNIESLGYGLSQALFEGLRTLSLDQLADVYDELVPILQRLRGAHRTFRPMYPNFPTQVMAMDEAQLYVNALVHYWSDGQLFPHTAERVRLPLLDPAETTMLDLGTVAEFEAILTQIVGANASLSEQDRDDVAWFAASYGEAIGPLLPDAIPQKETLAFVAGQLVRHVSAENAAAFIGRYVKTATDTLRLAVALSGGDLSLAAPTRFRTFSRPERRLLLSLLERASHPTEDMLRWKGRWLRLGEKLHPGEMAGKYPNAARAFSVLRDDLPFTTFHGAVEKALAHADIEAALARLIARPGDLARRLDHLLRLETAAQESVLTAFDERASDVSTPVLLQVRHHFAVRPDRQRLRVFFPKGQVARAQTTARSLPQLPPELCRAVVDACERALVRRFAALPGLGRVYIDPALADYKAPHSQRSASKSLRTLARGSRIPLPDADTLRFFVWWTNGADRTDIDLSAVLFDENFRYLDVLAYYNLKGFGGVHSGDIVDAPDGAAEFIDVSREKLGRKGVRFVVMTLHSYTQQPYCDLPECLAGWMARKKPGSGEIFAPRTVQDRIDVTANTKVAIPLVFDVAMGKAIWCDLALRRHPAWHNNVATSLTGIHLALRAMLELEKPDLFTLFQLHARARGEEVLAVDGADTVFSVAAGTPYRLDEIAAEYMG